MEREKNICGETKGNKRQNGEAPSEDGFPSTSSTENKKRRTSNMSDLTSRMAVPVSASKPAWAIPITTLTKPHCLENVLLICKGDEELGKQISLALNYAALSSVYSVEATLLFLEVPQCLVLSLLYGLVIDNIPFFVTLMQASACVDQLRSSFLRVWLRDDFNFDKKDITRGLETLRRLAKAIEIPGHLMYTLSGLAVKYGVGDIWTGSRTELGGVDIEKKLCAAVESNNASEVIAAIMNGGDVNFRTASGETLLHLAASSGHAESITALGYLKGDINARDSERLVPIHKAIKAGALNAVKALLEVGADIKRTVLGGDTVLHLAVREGRKEIIEVLIDNGADINAKNNSNINPLGEAVRTGKAEIVAALLERGAAADVVIEGRSLIELATASGNAEIVKSLRKVGADVNASSKEGDKLLHIAAYNGNIDVINEIIHGNVVFDCKNNNGVTPLHLSCEKEVLQALISREASIYLKSYSGATVLHKAAGSWSHSPGATIDSENEGGDTPLSVAASCGRVDIIKLLLNEGANPKISNKSGLSPLHHAAIYGCVKSLEALLQAGAVVDFKDKEGMTAAHKAAEHGKLAALQLLLQHGAGMSSKAVNDVTMIHSAALNGHKEVVAKLLDLGMNIESRCGYKFLSEHTTLLEKEKGGYNRIVRTLINLKENSNLRAIHLASFKGNLSVVKLLFDHGTSITVKDSHGWMPFHYAAMGGNLTLIQWFVEHGLDIYVKTDQHLTAAHIAASEGHIEVLKYFLGINMPLGIGDPSKWTMLHHASAAGKLSTVKYLLERGADRMAETVHGNTPLDLSNHNSRTDVSALLNSIN